jgi:sensor domain CHASE-containing protein
MKRKEEFMLQNVGGENLLVPLGRRVMDLNGIVVLNDTGRFIWELLARERSDRELASAVAGRFDVDAARAGADVKAFVDQISRIGLLEHS